MVEVFAILSRSSSSLRDSRFPGMGVNFSDMYPSFMHFDPATATEQALSHARSRP